MISDYAKLVGVDRAGIEPEGDPVDPAERAEFIDELRKRFQSR